MKSLVQIINDISQPSIPILDAGIPLDAYTLLNLSSENPDLKELELVDPVVCQHYINRILHQNTAQVACGGYLEKRNLYADKASFSGAAARNIHLGLDFWAKEGTKVLVPIDGKVHSFQNNATIGDYGPTIILKHSIGDRDFHTLYGHLSLSSLEGLFVGKLFRQGETLASLGSPDINVNYAPHLHFQIIDDIEGKKGDYPGVCAEKDQDFYSKNCPDPNILLKISF